MNEPSSSFAVSAGKLTEPSFANEQARLDAYAAAIVVTPPNGYAPQRGEKGDNGDTWEPKTLYIDVVDGAESVNAPTGVNLESMIVNLVCREKPTIHIMGVRSNTVYLSGAATANAYQISYTQWVKK